MNPTPWIEHLGLKPLEIEGGWYREMYRSNMVASAGRSLGTAIYYFLQDGDRSAFHKLDVDELYFFLEGDPVEVFIVTENDWTVHVLGPDVEKGHLRMISISKNTWQAARLASGSQHALLSTVTFPAFQFDGFELGVCAELVLNHPEHREVINQMTKA